MDFDDTPEEAAFRTEVRAWLADHARPKRPGELSTTRNFYDFDEVFVAEGRQWQRTLFDGGWAGITWPKEYGGRDGSSIQAMIFAQEESQFDVPQGLFGVGIGMVGPTIIAHGTDAQKERYLPAMLRGEEVWCQLFSEPGAGSDLANLATRAELDGDTWVVTGQKVWSSGAHLSDWGILLARTDPDQPKHRGITAFLVDMKSPGIEVRPLRQMTGGASFNEVFLTDVAIPPENVVGEVNRGWYAAMTTLANERSVSGQPSGFLPVLELARACEATGDAVLRQRLADCFIRTEILRYLGYRARTALSRGTSAGPETSIMKLFYSELARETTALTIELQGPTGVLMGDGPKGIGYWQQQFLSSPSLRIAAGSDEVQRNVIGERVLGLPGEPRTDKDVPYRALSGR